MNCKPNDLAIVIRADAVPELIGQIVEVICASMIDSPLGLIWLVRFPEPKRFPGVFPGSIIIDTDANCPDAWLKPVSGLPINDDVSDEVTA